MRTAAWCAVTAGQLVVGSSCGDRVCTLLGCDSGATLQVAAFSEPDHADLQGAAIEVCLNDQCVTESLDQLPMQGETIVIGLGSQLDRRIELTMSRVLPPPNDVIDLGVSYRSGDPDLFANGDVFTVSVRSAAGAALASAAWRARYSVLQPNGPDCEPTCRVIDVLEPVEGS